MSNDAWKAHIPEEDATKASLMVEDPERYRLQQQARFQVLASANTQAPVDKALLYPTMAQLFFDYVAQGRTIDEINRITHDAGVAYEGKMTIRAVIDSSGGSQRHGGMQFIWHTLTP
jgi:hypothetical protein